MSIIKNNTFCKLFEVIDGDVQGQVLVMSKDDTNDESGNPFFIDLITEYEGIIITAGFGFNDEQKRQDAFDSYTANKACDFFHEAKTIVTEASVGEDQEAS